ncbi:threonine/serine exporter family protein [Amycolatopsis sp. cg13]|uniref:threonine/serine exporter family protein n=1 Tax=Amycolatopsis sp. cg13 TaxID=3238807 RepID=UPI003525D331
MATDEREQARRVLGFALDVAMQMFQQGIETAVIVRTVRGLALAGGVEDLRISVGVRAIHLQYCPGRGEEPLVLFGSVQANDARDIGRMGDLEALAVRAGAGAVSPADAERDAEILARSGPTWPWYVSLLGGCLLAAMICLQANGTVLAAMVSAGLFVFANRVGWALSTVGIAEFFQVAAKASTVLAVAISLLSLGLLTGHEAASLSAANLVLLLPILSLVSLVEDAVGDFHLMAAARIVTVLLLTGAIATGVMVVVSVANDLDILGEASRVSLAALPLALVPVTALVGSLGNAILMGTPARWWLLACGAGLVTSLVNWAERSVLGLSMPVAIFLATTVLGLLAGAAARILQVPTAVVTIPGLTGAVLPGPAMYLSLSQVFARVPGAWDAVAEAIVSTAAIGVGVVLGLQFAALRRPGAVLLGEPRREQVGPGAWEKGGERRGFR